MATEQPRRDDAVAWPEMAASGSIERRDSGPRHYPRFMNGAAPGMSCLQARDERRKAGATARPCVHRRVPGRSPARRSVTRDQSVCRSITSGPIAPKPYSLLIMPSCFEAHAGWLPTISVLCMARSRQGPARCLQLPLSPLSGERASLSALTSATLWW